MLLLIVIYCLIQFSPSDAIAKDQVFDVQAFYPEGPQVVNDDIFWAEMTYDRIRRWSGGQVTTVWAKAGCGPTSIKKNGKHYWILCHRGGEVVRVDEDFKKQISVVRTADGVRISWPNDECIGPAGLMFATLSGIFSLEAQSEGKVVILDGGDKAKVLLNNIRYANGITYRASDNVLFLSEHLNRRILKITLNNKLEVVRKDVFTNFDALTIKKADYPLAGPDGMILLESGDLIVAEYGAGRLLRFNRDGVFKSLLNVPMKYVTNMALIKQTQELVVTGAYNNEIFPMEGRVIRVSLNAFSLN